MAVNEENAAGGQVVTAPTNGAAGVVPAVIRYYRDHCIGATHTGDRLWQVMDACIERGLATDGTLPGGLKVRRRAKAIHQALLAERGNNLAQPHVANEWLSVYAMAVNEENAAGGQVVTAPTNGAAGVVPAVIRYYR
ncbi:hypothetical protein CNY89_23740, partial [Amaricoccus sp. HAR-UPW-R2A-40]